MFQKQSTRNALVLIERMPHMEGMPITPEQLRELQDDDLIATRQRFALMGVEVPDET
jgi:hypothetical protein